MKRKQVVEDDLLHVVRDEHTAWIVKEIVRALHSLKVCGKPISIHIEDAIAHAHFPLEGLHLEEKPRFLVRRRCGRSRGHLSPLQHMRVPHRVLKAVIEGQPPQLVVVQ